MARQAMENNIVQDITAKVEAQASGGMDAGGEDDDDEDEDYGGVGATETENQEDPD